MPAETTSEQGGWFSIVEGKDRHLDIGTKQDYPKEGEKRTDYPGENPMVHDPATGRTRAYPIPIPHQGILSITFDESRGIAFISPRSDERSVESAHFLVLDLATGRYRELMDTHHMYSFTPAMETGPSRHPRRRGEAVCTRQTADTRSAGGGPFSR